PHQDYPHARPRPLLSTTRWRRPDNGESNSKRGQENESGSLIGDHPRRGLEQFHFVAHLLELRCQGANLGLLLSNGAVLFLHPALLFFYLAVLFQEFIE